jgi:hypothetical protein
MLWVRISIRARCTALCDKVCQWLVTGRWFSPGTPISSTNRIDRHDIAEILLKVALNTIKQTNNLRTSYAYYVTKKHPRCLRTQDQNLQKPNYILKCPPNEIYFWYLAITNLTYPYNQSIPFSILFGLYFHHNILWNFFYIFLYLLFVEFLFLISSVLFFLKSIKVKPTNMFLYF